MAFSLAWGKDATGTLYGFEPEVRELYALVSL
jgi:hypothetical protein